jgi:hypothetical protein
MIRELGNAYAPGPLLRTSSNPPPPPPPPLQYLHTLVVKDEEKANKLKHSLPPGLARVDIPAKA